MKRCLLLLILLINTGILFGKGKFNTELSGRLAVGFSYDYLGAGIEGQDYKKSYYWVNDYDAVLIGEAEAEFTINAGSVVKGFFELEADHNSAGVKIDQCWIQFSFKKPVRLRLGNQRKVLGLEELHGIKSRITIHRSFINRYIRSFEVLEHDPMIHVRVKKEWDKTSIKCFALTGGDGDVRVFGNIGMWLEWENGTVGFSDLYTWHWDSEYSDYRNITNSNISVISLEYFKKLWYGSFEVFSGLDPNASDLSRRMGNFRKVYFGAVKILITRRFALPFGLINGIEPIASGSWLMNDTDEPTKGYSELLGGVTVHFATKFQVRWMTNLAGVYAHNYAGVTFGRYSLNISSQVQIVW